LTVKLTTQKLLNGGSLLWWENGLLAFAGDLL
jgi:hypothetical protein